LRLLVAPFWMRTRPRYVFWPKPAEIPFAHDRRLGVLADVDHLRAGVGLLVVVGQRDE
jgi:hypothetical protein